MRGAYGPKEFGRQSPGVNHAAHDVRRCRPDAVPHSRGDVGGEPTIGLRQGQARAEELQVKVKPRRQRLDGSSLPSTGSTSVTAGLPVVTRARIERALRRPDAFRYQDRVLRFSSNSTRSISPRA